MMCQQKAKSFTPAPFLVLHVICGSLPFQYLDIIMKISIVAAKRPLINLNASPYLWGFNNNMFTRLRDSRDK